MKYAPLFLLLAATSAHANGWEWKRQPITPEEYCEIKRIAKLTPQLKCDLDAIMESERVAMNQQTMMQYNRALPIPLPLMPTPVVAPPPKSQRGFHKFFH
jgi:hypothetical protein